MVPDTRQYCRLEPSDIDSSSVFVCTPITSIAGPVLDIPPLIRKITTTVTFNQTGIFFMSFHGSLQIGGQNFHPQPTASEYDGLYIIQQEIRGNPAGFGDDRLTDAQFRINYWWIVKDKMLLSPWSAILIDKVKWSAEQLFRQFPGVGDGGRGADELGFGTIKPADTAQAADQICQVAAKNAPIMVNLINHYELQIFEQPYPQGMVR